MNSIIDSLMPAIDSILGVRDTIGAALKPVYFVTRVWSGSEPGDGIAFDIATQMLPSPQIVDLSHNMRLIEGGGVKQGDIMLKLISKNSYPSIDFIWRKSLARNTELFYQVGDYLYQVINVVEKHLTWDAQLRMLSDQTRY